MTSRALPWISTVTSAAALLGCAIGVCHPDALLWGGIWVGYLDRRLELGGAGALLGAVAGFLIAVSTGRSSWARRWQHACLASPSRAPAVEVARGCALAALVPLATLLAVWSHDSLRTEPRELPWLLVPPWVAVSAGISGLALLIAVWVRQQMTWDLRGTRRLIRWFLSAPLVLLLALHLADAMARAVDRLAG